MILGARHVGFVVVNMALSARFYEGLGFEPEGPVATESGLAASTLVGIDGVTIRTLKMSLRRSKESIWRESGFRLELIEYVEPLSQELNTQRNNVVGKGHICLTVDDLMEAINLVIGLGGSAPFNPVHGPSGEPLVSYVLDPDGIPIELSEHVV
jgi:catechol 2,3-dioxygenase-like lactoylglutathione lyase family enzyme